MKFDIRTGKAGEGADYDSPASLARTAKMGQLQSIAKMLGVSVDASGSKEKAAKKIWTTAEKALGTTIQAAEKKKTAPRQVKERAPARYVFRSFKADGLSDQCAAIVGAAEAAGKTEFTKEELKAVIATVPCRGDIWKNFMWYRSKVLVPKGLMS